MGRYHDISPISYLSVTILNFRLVRTAAARRFHELYYRLWHPVQPHHQLSQACRSLKRVPPLESSPNLSIAVVV